jgi:hypothetical protein
VHVDSAREAHPLSGLTSGRGSRRRLGHGRRDGRRSCLALWRGGSSARPAPRLVTDCPVRHPTQAKLGERADVVALEAHEGNQHLMPIAVEDGRRTATARLGFSAGGSERLARTREHRRGDFVEHDSRGDEQADLTRQPKDSTAAGLGRAVGGLAAHHLGTSRPRRRQRLSSLHQVRRQGVAEIHGPTVPNVDSLGR